MNTPAHISLFAACGLLAASASCVMEDEPVSETATASHDVTVQPAATAVGGVAVQPGLELTPVATGPGWQRLSFPIPDSAGNATGEDDEIIVISGVGGLQAAPIPAVVKSHLSGQLGGVIKKQLPGGTYALDPQAAQVADTTGEIAPPSDVDVMEGELLLFLHAATVESLGAELSEKPKTGVMAKGSCPNTNWEKSWGWSWEDQLKKEHVDDDGPLTSEVEVKVQVDVFADATVRLRKLRVFAGLGCVTYGVAFRNIELGALTSGRFDFEARGDFEKGWKPTWTLAKPKLFEQTFWIGPIPVPIGVNLPITAGVELDADASLELGTSASGWGAARLICTTDGCTRYDATYFDWDELLQPDATLQGKARVEPWAQIAARIYVFSDSLVHAQGGVRPYVRANLWGHAGQGCGDGDGDGVADYVTALTADVSAGLDVTAAVDLIGFVDESWRWNILDHHLGFWSAPPATALEPLAEAVKPAPSTDEIFDPSTGGGGKFRKEIRFRMRPCWPFAAPITYRIEFDSGAVVTRTAAPSQTVVLTPSWTTGGTKTVEITALHDADGRQIDATTDLTIKFTKVVVPKVPPKQIPTGGLEMQW